MAESQVYYMDAHSESTETSLAAKMITVFDAAGLDEIVKPCLLYTSDAADE